MKDLAGPAPSQVLFDREEVPQATEATTIANQLFPKCGMPSMALSDEEKKIKISEFWKTVFEEEGMSLQDSHPHRIVVAYRFCRELLILTQGEGSAALPLVDLLAGEGPDLWSRLEPKCDSPPADRNYSYKRRVWNAVFDAGYTLGICPPAVPEHFQNEAGQVDKDYDPNEDVCLGLWHKVFQLVSWRLGFGQPPLENPKHGPLSVRGMDSPEWVRFLWPTMSEVIMFEQALVSEAADLVADGGIRLLGERLKLLYCFSSKEVGRVANMAFGWLKGTMGRDIEEQRLLIASRLAKISDRARDAGNTRDELSAVKQMATVLGVTRAGPRDDVTDFIEAVAKVAEKENKKRIEE